MKFQQVSIILSLLMIAAGARASVKPVIDLQARQFPPKDVRLLDGPFQRAMNRDARYLLSLDVDRLLSGFRSEAGLTPKAPKYGGGNPADWPGTHWDIICRPARGCTRTPATNNFCTGSITS